MSSPSIVSSNKKNEDSKTAANSSSSLFVENSPLYFRMSLVCYAVIFLYATAFWIQVGVFPFLSKKLGIDTVVFGYLQTASAIALLLGGPLLGRMGDLFGAKVVFILSFVGSFFFYFVTAMADNAFHLLISRMFSFLMNAMQCAQMVMTDVTGTRDRAVATGRLTVAYGMGMIVGPTLGGWITVATNEQYAAGAAALLMLLALVIILVTMPAHTKDPRRVEVTKDKASSQDKNLFNFKAILTLLAIPEVFYFIGVKTLVGIPAGIFHAMFSVVNMERFDLTPEINGYILTYIGLLTAIMQGFGIKWFTVRFTDLPIIRISIVIMAFSYLLLVVVDSIWLLGLVLVPMVTAGSLMNTIASSAVTKSVSDMDTGTTIGLTMATHSLIRTVSPTVGAYLYTWFGYASFGLIGFIFNGAVAVLVYAKPPPGVQ